MMRQVQMEAYPIKLEYHHKQRVYLFVNVAVLSRTLLNFSEF